MKKIQEIRKSAILQFEEIIKNIIEHDEKLKSLEEKCIAIGLNSKMLVSLRQTGGENGKAA